jgi:hypothetical protein
LLAVAAAVSLPPLLAQLLAAMTAASALLHRRPLLVAAGGMLPSLRLQQRQRQQQRWREMSVWQHWRRNWRHLELRQLPFVCRLWSSGTALKRTKRYCGSKKAVLPPPPLPPQEARLLQQMPLLEKASE